MHRLLRTKCSYDVFPAKANEGVAKSRKVVIPSETLRILCACPASGLWLAHKSSEILNLVYFYDSRPLNGVANLPDLKIIQAGLFATSTM